MLTTISKRTYVSSMDGSGWNGGVSQKESALFFYQNHSVSRLENAILGEDIINAISKDTVIQSQWFRVDVNDFDEFIIIIIECRDCCEFF